MTEHTPEKVSDLIAEVRGWLNDHRHFHSARRSHVRLLADALEAVSAERDEARIWAETMQAQKFEWEGKEATVRAERDEALAVIAEALAYAKALDGWRAFDGRGKHLVALLSRIPEHPKED